MGQMCESLIFGKKTLLAMWDGLGPAHLAVL